MSTVPNSLIGQLTFYEEHIPVWTAAPTAIGLTAAQCTQLAAAITAARNQFNLAQSVRSAAKSQTITMHQKFDAMNEQGADLIRIIRAFANVQNDPTVYTKAEIPPPPTPSPVPAPGTPTNFRVALNPDGQIVLTWKCENPTGSQGTVYEIKRRVGDPASNPFEFIGNAGRKTFTDSTLAPGAAGGEYGVTYRITAVRSTKRGITGIFTVNFGAGLTVTEEFENTEGGEESMKIAA